MGRKSVVTCLISEPEHRLTNATRHLEGGAGVRSARRAKGEDQPGRGRFLPLTGPREPWECVLLMSTHNIMEIFSLSVSTWRDTEVCNKE